MGGELQFADVPRARLLSVAILALLALTLGTAGPVAADYTPTGPLVADSGFRPQPNGYSFENYGDDPGTVSLSAAEMVKLFGREVCENATGRCRLTAIAQRYMDSTNSDMDGGHCMGMAVTAELFHARLGRPRTASLLAGRATTVFGLPRSAKVQRHIAYGWAFQLLPSVQSRASSLDARRLIAQLRDTLGNRKEAFTLGIFKRDGDGGHAITPFAIEDRGGGRFGVLVYDNNYPGETRAMNVNVNSNVWNYQASPNPKLRAGIYDGKGKDSILRLFPSTPGLGDQDCFFCRQSKARRPKLSLQWSGDPDTREHGNLLIRDRKGRRTGCGDFGRGYECRNRIPGADFENLILGGELVWLQSTQPTYKLPSGRGYSISLTGGKLRRPAREGVVLIGKDRFAGIAGVKLQPGERETISISRAARTVIFKNDRRQVETPRLQLGVDSKGPSYVFELKANRLRPGARVGFRLNAKRRRVTIRARGLARTGRYSVKVVKISARGRTILRRRVAVRSGDVVAIRYGVRRKPARN